MLIVGDLSQSMRFLRKLSVYRHPIMRDRYSIYDELVPINYLPMNNLSKYLLADHAAIILAQNDDENENKKRYNHIYPMCVGRLHLFDEESTEPLTFTESIIASLKKKEANKPRKSPWRFWQRQISNITPTSVSTRLEWVKS